MHNSDFYSQQFPLSFSLKIQHKFSPQKIITNQTITNAFIHQPINATHIPIIMKSIYVICTLLSIIAIINPASAGTQELSDVQHQAQADITQVSDNLQAGVANLSNVIKDVRDKHKKITRASSQFNNNINNNPLLRFIKYGPSGIRTSRRRRQ